MDDNSQLKDVTTHEMSEGGFCYSTEKPLKSRPYKNQNSENAFFIDYKNKTDSKILMVAKKLYAYLYVYLLLDVVAHDCDLSTWEAKAHCYQSEASLICTRPARAPQ